MIHLVCGPPGAGKSTWVRENAGSDDLVIDLDEIRRFTSSDEQAKEFRKHLEDDAHKHPADVYVVRTLADPVARGEVAARVQADRVVVLETPGDIASQRALERDGDDSMAEPIRRWWETYQPREGEVIVRPDMGDNLPDKEVNSMTENVNVQDAKAEGSSVSVNEFGYPDDTPIKDMTAEQQAAYWKRQARKHEEAAKKNEPGKVDDSVIAEAVQKAIAEERERSERELGERLLASKFEVLAKEKGVDPAKVERLFSSLNKDAFVSGSEVNDDALEEFFEPFTAIKSAPNAHAGFRDTKPVSGKAKGDELLARF